MMVKKITLSLLILFFILKSSFFYTQKSFFIENKGQVVDQNNEIVKGVLFTLTTKNYNVNFYKNHFAYEVFSTKNKGVEVNRFEIWPELISRNLKIKANGIVNEGYNFIQATSKVEGVNEFKELVYQNIWKGVDIVFFIAKNQLKYNYIVSPQAKDEIKLNIRGATPSVVQKEIRYSTKEGVLLRENFPACYWEGESDFPLLNRVKIKTSNSSIQFIYPHNREKKLIIDPIAYAQKETSYYGGIHQDFAEDIVLNSKKELIISGYTLSLNNIATTGAYQQFIDNVDSYIAKFDSLGNRIWATYFGGNDFERSFSVAVDSYDNIILSGNSMSVTGVATLGAYQTTLQSTDDSFIAKFTDNGTLLWSTYFGGNNHDFISSIATDDQDNIYFTGHTSSADYPITNDAHLSVFPNAETAYFTKLSSAGQLIHSSFIGSGEGKGNEIIIGGGGIYIVGATKATNGISFSSSYQSTLGGDWDGFVLKMDKNTYLPILGSYFGGVAEDKFNGGKLVSDKLYLVGYTNSATNISDANSYQALKSSYEDGMLVAFDTLGNKLWSTYIGGNGTDYLSSIDELNGDLWLIGSSTSNNLFTDSSAFQEVNKGGYDIFVSKFTTTGNQIWCSYKGSIANDYGNALVIENSSNFYFCGNTGSNSSFSTINAHQVYFGGNAFDGFWSKICKPIYPTYLSESVDTISICMGDSIQVSSLNSFSSYSWNTGNTTSGLVIKNSGDYYLETIDSYGCPGKSDVISVVIFTDTVDIDYSSMFICDNDSVLLLLDTTYTSYLWSNMGITSDQYIQNAGLNWCVVEDNNGCTFYSDTLELQQSNQLYSINVLGTPVICSGGEVILYVNSSGLDNYSWSNNEQTPSVNINSPGNYWLVGTNIEGCPIYSDTIEVIVSNYQNQNVSLNILDTINICRGDSVQIIVNEPFVSYEWHNGSVNNNFTSLEEGMAYVSVVDTNSCTSRSDTVVVQFFFEKEINVLYSQQLQICEGDSVQVSANDSLFQINWSNGSQGQSNWLKTEGLNHYNAIDANGCHLFSDTVEINLFQEIKPIIQVIANPAYCNNLPAVLQADSGLSTWNSLWVSDSLIIFDDGGYYYSIVDPITGCQWYSDTLNVVFVDPKESKIVTNKKNVCFGEQLTLSQEIALEINSLLWDSIVMSNAYSFILDSSRYAYLTMTDINNCIIYDSVYLEGKECFESVLFYPNPTNGYLRIKSPNKIQECAIFNGLGELVKKENEINLNEFTLDLSPLNIGLYSIVLYGANEDKVIKIEVVH